MKIEFHQHKINFPFCSNVTNTFERETSFRFFTFPLHWDEAWWEYLTSSIICNHDAAVKPARWMNELKSNYFIPASHGLKVSFNLFINNKIWDQNVFLLDIFYLERKFKTKFDILIDKEVLQIHRSTRKAKIYK